MKKVLLAAFTMTMTMAAFSQIKPPVKDTIQTPTVQCEMCKARIEQHLKRIDGVTFADVKFKPKQKFTVVKYFADRTNIEIIKASIANAGYQADEIDANPDAYKLLPKCCKKPEDGGGMPRKN